MQLYLPFKGDVRLTSPFGPRILYGKPDNHKGLDLVGINDITVYAPCDGVIGTSMIRTDTDNKDDLTWQWGNFIRLDTSDGLYIFMCHLQTRLVQKGQRVKRGDKLGIMGNTGYSSGAHTHFEVRNNWGVSLNPCPYLGIENKVGIYNQNNILERDDSPMTTAEKEEFKKLQEQVKSLEKEVTALDNQVSTQWNKISDLPSWAQDTVTRLCNLGFLEGDGSGLSLSYQMTRLLVILDRAGVFAPPEFAEDSE